MGSNDHFFQLYIIYIHLYIPDIYLRKEIRLPLNEPTALFMYPDPVY